MDHDRLCGKVPGCSLCIRKRLTMTGSAVKAIGIFTARPETAGGAAFGNGRRSSFRKRPEEQLEEIQ